MRGQDFSRERVIIITALTLFAIVIGMNCSDDNGTGPSKQKSSRAYQGHANDTDMDNFAKAYQGAIATRLDDCQTCHTGGTVSEPKVAGNDVQANPCDYCHYIIHPPEGWTGLPTSFEETLNPYGADYKAAGRNYAAILNIADTDSDGDEHTNSEEINALRYPGDAGSYPGLELCPVIKVTRMKLKPCRPIHSSA